MRPILARLGLVALSACLQILCFPTSGPIPFARACLGFIALAPLLIAVLRQGRTNDSPKLSHLAGLGYLCGVVWYLGSCSWIYETMYLYGGLPKSVALLILVLFSLYLGLYHGLFALLIAFLARTRLGTGGSLLVSPMVWVAFELARSRVTGFPWDLLGNTQVDSPLLASVAPVAGVMGISLILAGVNAAMAAPWVSKSRHARPMAYGAVAFAALVMIVSPHLRRHATIAGTTSTAVLLQENIAVGASAQGDVRLSQQEELAQFSALSAHPEPVDGRASRPTLVIWPEAPSGFQSNELDVRDALSELARKLKTPLVIGVLGVDLDRSAPAGYYSYDSAEVLSRTGFFEGRYDKIHLVPWGEYVPYKEVFRFAEKLTAGAGNMDPGHSRSVFRLEGHRYGIFICYESIFGDEVREFVKNGAEVLVNISDDGWYGDSGAPWQHLNMARMRAIENHRWILRDTNTGETTAIDPWGNYTMTRRHVRTAYALPFGFSQEMTFYTLHGDWLAYLCALITGGLLVYAAIHKLRLLELK